MKKSLYFLFACFICLYLAGCSAVTTTRTIDPGLRRISAVGAGVTPRPLCVSPPA